MILWLIFAALAGAVAFVLLRPLTRSAVPDAGAAGDVALYEAQIGEIERDEARNLLTPTEAATLRAEPAAVAAGTGYLRRPRGRGGTLHAAQPRRDARQSSRHPRRRLAALRGSRPARLPSRPLAARLSPDPGKLEVDVALGADRGASGGQSGRCARLGTDRADLPARRAGRDAARAYAALIRAGGARPTGSPILARRAC